MQKGTTCPFPASPTRGGSGQRPAPDLAKVNSAWELLLRRYIETEVTEFSMAF